MENEVVSALVTYTESFEIIKWCLDLESDDWLLGYQFVGGGPNQSEVRLYWLDFYKKRDYNLEIASQWRKHTKQYKLCFSGNEENAALFKLTWG